LHGIEEDGYREVRERKVVELRYSAFCEAILGFISSVQQLATKDWHVVFCLKSS
jgi:hypothetical protein